MCVNSPDLGLFRPTAQAHAQVCLLRYVHVTQERMCPGVPVARCACHQDRLKVRQALLSPPPLQPPCDPELWVKGTLAAVRWEHAARRARKEARDSLLPGRDSGFLET